MFNPGSWNQSIALKMVAEDLEALTAAATYPAGYLPINGTLAHTYLALLPVASTVKIASAADDRGVVFTVVGTVDGAIFSEQVVGANAGTASTVALFDTVVSVTPDVDTTGNVTVGDVTTGNGVCLSQAGTANTALTIDGPYLSGQYNNYYPQYLIIDCAGNESGNTFTFFGSDQSGSQYIYSVAGANAGQTAPIPIPYKLIGNSPSGLVEGYILMENAAAGDVSVGIAEETATPWIQCDQARPYFEVGVNVILSTGATLTYTVETTLQNAIRSVITSPVPDQTLNGSSNPLGTTLLNGPTGFFRLVIDTWTDGYATLYSAQIGSAFASTPNNRRPT